MDLTLFLKLRRSLFSCRCPFHIVFRTLFERTGQYLYELFQSAKTHIYSGPVDELTGHSKFTLSDSYILRVADFSEKEIILKVIHTEAEEEQVIEVSR